MAETQTSDRRAAKREARLAQQITSFVRRHSGEETGQAATAQVSHLGYSGARICLVAGDGTWGDLVAPSMATAQHAAEQAEVEVRETFADEMAERMHTGPYEWSRMAGIQLGGPATS